MTQLALGVVMDFKRTILMKANGLRATVRRSRPQRTRARRPAFTLVEMVMVLLIMGILAATATPTFFRSLQYHRLESAARRVKLDLEQARDAARVRSQEQSFEFINATTYKLPSGIVSLKSTGQAYTVDLAATPYEIENVTVNFGGQTSIPNSISFDGYGNATTGGTIDLALGSETRTVTINSPSGQITYSNP